MGVRRGPRSFHRQALIAMLVAQNDEWAASRARYMSLEELAQFSDDPQARPRRISAA